MNQLGYYIFCIALSRFYFQRQRKITPNTSTWLFDILLALICLLLAHWSSILATGHSTVSAQSAAVS